MHKSRVLNVVCKCFLNVYFKHIHFCPLGGGIVMSLLFALETRELKI